MAIGTAGETACPTLLDQSFAQLGGAGGFACQRKLVPSLIQNPQNGQAPWEALAMGSLLRSTSGMNPYQKYIEGIDPMTVLAATPQRLRELTAGLSESQLQEHPAPGKWSIHEIVAHSP